MAFFTALKPLAVTAATGLANPAYRSTKASPTLTCPSNRAAHTDIAQIYEGAFKAGFNHNEIAVDHAWPLATDTLMSMGECHITGKNQSGAPIEVKGIWTGIDVRKGGSWKIRLLTAFPKAPLRRISVSSCNDIPLPRKSPSSAASSLLRRPSRIIAPSTYSPLCPKADSSRTSHHVRFSCQNRKSAKCHFLILVEQKERPPRGGLSESNRCSIKQLA
ncbi:hypothetical protein SAMN05444169_3987 [Bradyrhizobium erythrophlei]|uniref:Uncharacterized protein n=1 Tax=Bradyrhizobium erythrophlei TaxID=1437360 RepID=A0A1M5MEI8_9BRAD|nr:hypothetical protein SAMN05444169_3987 [Bradyrhizobium erythrophlei]